MVHAAGDSGFIAWANGVDSSITSNASAISTETSRAQAAEALLLSTATASATYAPLASPALTGLPTTNGISSLAALGPAIRRQNAPATTVLTGFQSGHGWTSGGTGITWNLNDTSDYVVGSQCVSGVTAGTGGVSWVQSAAFTAIDCTKLDFTLWIKVTGLAHLLKLNPIFSTDSGLTSYYQANVWDGTQPGAPIAQMRDGEWFPLRFNVGELAATGTGWGPFSTGTPNIASIVRIRLPFQDDNTGNAVTIKLGKLEYHTRSTQYASGVVSIGFDDSFISVYSKAAPKLAQYGYAGTAYTIAEFANNPGATYVSTAQLQQMQTQGWEVAAHAYTSANHAAGFTTLSTSALNTELANLKSWALDNGFAGADHLAYPLGYHSATTDLQVQKFFATGRTLATVPHDTYRPAVPLRTRSYLVSSTTSLATVQAQIDACVSAGTWLQLVFHDLVTSGPTGNQVTISNFNSVIDYIAGKAGLRVQTVGDVWRNSDR